MIDKNVDIVVFVLCVLIGVVFLVYGLIKLFVFMFLGMVGYF